MKTIFIRFTFLVAVLVLNVVCLFGQNYKTVHFDREGYFESEGFGLYPDGSGLPNLSTSNEDQVRFGIRIDTLLSDDLNYVFPIYWEDSNFLYLQRPSWLGDTLKLSLNGTEVFRNKNGELITINTQAELGHTWHIFELLDTAYLQAEVTAISYQEVLGQMDSIRIVLIQAKNIDGENIDHDMNGFTLVLGKESGFVETCDMYHFPVRQNKIHLIGLTNPEVGEKMLTTKTIFDFHVGDERHYNRLFDGGDYQDRKYKKWIVLDRNESNEDTIAYTFDYYEVQLYVDDYSDDFVTITSDTIVIKYDLNNKMHNTHPFEISEESSMYFGPQTFVFKNDNGDWFKYAFDGIWAGSDSLIPNDFERNRIYYQACLGMTHFNRVEQGVFGTLNEDLVYYKKGTTEWGTPIDFVALTATKKIQNPKSSILVHPNPANDNITITSKNPNQKLQHIQVINTLGQKIADWPCAQQNQLNKSVVNFPTAIYWLLVTDEAGEIWRMSFIRGK
jgi:hypothetical protein